jgi:hypothetical protein
MPVAVAACRQRVDPIDLVAGRQQRPHQQAAIQLNPNHDLPGVLGVPGDERVQVGHAGQPVGDAALGQHRTLLVEQPEVVVALGQSTPTNSTSILPGRGRFL